MLTARTAHPRSRGEHTCCATVVPSLGGSSPLTRGARKCQARRCQFSGLIPAHAGSTAGYQIRSQSGRAHPRSRGEHFFMATVSGSLLGSSPLTRGARHHVPPPTGLPRLIPAHAGSTIACMVDLRAERAHPRSRGEHAVDPLDRAHKRGSSPLTRGALNSIRADALAARLIPAHAGSTCCRCHFVPR